MDAYVAPKAASTCSPRWPVHSTTCRTRAATSASSRCARNGRPATSASTLGRSASTERRRVPNPPARITAVLVMLGERGCPAGGRPVQDLLYAVLDGVERLDLAAGVFNHTIG